MSCPKREKPIDSAAVKAWKLIAIASAVALMAIGTIAVGLAGFEYWRRGQPEYSINRIGVAIETHDLQLFRKHVDVRSITSRLIDDLTRQSANDNTSNLSMAMAGLLKPQLANHMSDQIERFVETGTFEGRDKAGADKTVEMLHDEFAGRLGPLTSKQYEGNVATLELTVNPRNEKERAVTLGLKMRRTDDGYWQLMEVSLPGPAQR